LLVLYIRGSSSTAEKLARQSRNKTRKAGFTTEAQSTPRFFYL
jgi:hypothetical protein